MYVAGYAYHVVQRGNNREACFFHEENYQFYLDVMGECLSRYGVQLHAYCLMTNHVHLLMSPQDETGISNVMKVLASRYAYALNKAYRRSGTIWEGRHKASAVSNGDYLLKCYRYIELNPVAANMVQRPEAYRWSSYHHNAWGDESGLISPHPDYLALSSDHNLRCNAYRELFATQLSEQDLHGFRTAAHYCMPVGDNRFCEQVATATGRALGHATLGRPRKQGAG